MSKTTKEWQMICDLMAHKEKMTAKNQVLFVQGLYDQLNEFCPISDELSEDQIEYLYALYKKYVEED